MAIIVATMTAGAAAGAAAAQVGPGECLSAAEEELVDLINDYRMDNGRPAIPVSFWLCAVGQWHVWDLQTNDPVVGDCSLHSWSDARPDLWSEVCYTPDHAQAEGMWIKPREISGGVYTGNGYEIAYWSSGGATAAGALAAWQGSPPHNAVILGIDIWAPLEPWPALGVGIFEEYAVAWFGDRGDPAGSMDPCAGIGIAAGDLAPHVTRIVSVYPNPLRPPAATIAVELARDDAARLAVYDIQGRSVADVFAGEMAAGRHTLAWSGALADGRRAPNGVYFLRLETPRATTTRRIVVSR